MNKTIISIILVIGIFIVTFLFLYQSYSNVEVSEEELALSVSYLGNITKIESASIELDFVNERMKYVSKFHPDNDSIILDSHSKGFQLSDGLCRDHFFAEHKDGTGSGGVWHDNKPVLLSNFEKIEHVEITKICDFYEPLIPNGKFIVHLYGIDKSGIQIETIPVTITFNTDKFRCTDSCVFSEQFLIKDQHSKRGVTTIILEGTNVDTKRFDFDIRTIGVDSETLSNLISIYVQVGIGVVIALVLFIISSSQQGRIRDAITQIQDIGKKQQKIIEEQNKRDLKKKETGEFFITHACTMLTIRTIELFNNFETYLDKKSTEVDWESQLEQWKYGRDLAIEHLETHHMIYSDVLNHTTSLWLFELIEDLKMFSKPVFESEVAKALMWGLFTAITAVGKSLTSKKLKQFLDENQELQKIMTAGKNELTSFADSPKFDEMLGSIGLSKEDIKKLKTKFTKRD